MDRTDLRFLVSTALILLITVETVTGILLFSAPSGPSYILGISKHFIEGVHTLGGFLMSGFVLIHLILNWPLYRAEMKKYLGGDEK